MVLCLGVGSATDARPGVGTRVFPEVISVGPVPWRISADAIADASPVA